LLFENVVVIASNIAKYRIHEFCEANKLTDMLLAFKIVKGKTQYNTACHPPHLDKRLSVKIVQIC
jgi:hypothetical protein